MPKIKSIKAEYSTSANIRDVWHRVGFTIELELTDDEQSKEKFSEVKTKAWQIVESEVEKQIKDLLA